MVNIGEKIKEIFDERGCTVVWFARQIPCSRKNVYDIFRRKSVDTQVLYRICKILDYDFFEEYSRALEERDV
jgi:predicted transcriptional regulator